jgi:predicted GH43/DUF377 family glycosyl hydrolase
LKKSPKKIEKIILNPKKWSTKYTIVRFTNKQNIETANICLFSEMEKSSWYIKRNGKNGIKDPIKDNIVEDFRISNQLLLKTFRSL